MSPPLTLYRTFHSRTIDGEVGYLVYLPPDYRADHDRRYPVVYWLHGLGCGPAVGEVFVWRLDQAIKAGRAAAMIAILVNGLPASMYCDSADGRDPVESVIIADLIPHVDATYRTIARREGRAIAGHSMGGFGSLRLAFKSPERFVAASGLAAALYRGRLGPGTAASEVFRDVFDGRREAFEARSPWTLLERNAGPDPQQDAYPSARRRAGSVLRVQPPLPRMARAAGVPHEFHVFRRPRARLRAVLRGIGRAGLRLLRERLRPGRRAARRRRRRRGRPRTARGPEPGGKSKRGRCRTVVERRVGGGGRILRR